MNRSLFLLIFIAMPLFSHAIEEPNFQIIRKIGSVELRQYDPFVVAEVVIDAPAEDAGKRAFPILAGYIFGKNKGEKKFAMTAPVTQSAVQSSTQVQFLLPASVSLEFAPEPLDSRVNLRLVPASQWAAIRYSGTWSKANYDENLLRLQTALAEAGVATQGLPVFARYNGPMTPFFMRRNEIWLEIK